MACRHKAQLPLLLGGVWAMQIEVGKALLHRVAIALTNAEDMNVVSGCSRA